jgi:hypothetical protein
MASSGSGGVPEWESQPWTLFVDDQCDGLVDSMHHTVGDAVGVVDVRTMARPLPPFLTLLPLLYRQSTKQVVVADHIPPFLARLHFFESRQSFKPAQLGRKGFGAPHGILSARAKLPWSVARQQEGARARTTQLMGGAKKLSAAALRMMMQEEAAAQDTMFRPYRNADEKAESGAGDGAGDGAMM